MRVLVVRMEDTRDIIAVTEAGRDESERAAFKRWTDDGDYMTGHEAESLLFEIWEVD